MKIRIYGQVDSNDPALIGTVDGDTQPELVTDVVALLRQAADEIEQAGEFLTRRFHRGSRR